ncbi:hypothetical protein GCM10010124_03710 [Pilimelia terevasa]|uniref:Integral membrane protein n=1 Tax=Pilimelia terevasa TaxID=53372 RepID=A0A8J3BH22_9ACTN|nr:DUF6350 family protein [Pilimelia terevasa]GGK14451.1 hypothetical protein GCM10010124_03710 [Pilimelia terevasa]
MAATRDETDPGRAAAGRRERARAGGDLRAGGGARAGEDGGTREVDGTQETVLLDLDAPADHPTVVLPRQRRGPRRRRAPLAVAACVAVGLAAAASLAPPLAAALVAAPGGAGAGLRLGLAAWLLGHGVPVRTPVGALTLAPLAVGLLAAWRMERAGLHAVRAVGARRTGAIGRTLAVTGALALVYGLLGGFAALVVGAGVPGVTAPRAVATMVVFGAVAGGLGAARASGVLDRVARWLPEPVRAALRAGALGAATLLAAGAAAAGLSLALSWHDASTMLAAYDTGVAGQLGLTALSVAYAPNVAVWAAAYLLGPGFALGTGTGVTVGDVSVGALPALPLFAGLPPDGLTGLGLFVAAAPVLAGGLGGGLLARAAARRAGADGPDWSRVCGAAALSGPVAGVLLGAAALASRGAVGDGRLADVGPPVLQVTLVAAGGGLVGAIVVAAACALLRRRR